MRIGIGLPAAVPGADMTKLAEWAAEGERAGFDAVGVIDRLVYDNLDPLVALAAAAARTERVELVTTVLNVGWRRNVGVAVVRTVHAGGGSGGGPSGLGGGGPPGAAADHYRALFSLGDDADAIAEEYLRHYYGDQSLATARADTFTTPERLRIELEALRVAGATDLILYPCSAGPEQIGLLAEAVRAAGFLY